MAIKNYSAAAETLIQLSGGKENFITVENCATRVRIQYKDLSKVDKKAIGEMDGVLSVIEKDGLQVVVGPGVCNKLCAAINEILSVDRAASTAAPDAPDVPEEKKKGNFLKIISDIFVPVLPAMIAGGIVQGLNNVLKSVAEARAAAAGIDGDADGCTGLAAELSSAELEQPDGPDLCLRVQLPCNLRRLYSGKTPER